MSVVDIPDPLRHDDPPRFNRLDMREAFYEGAQTLFRSFTTCAPFPAREMMDAAERCYPSPRELRTVTINGNQYRVKDGVIEVLTGYKNRQEWAPAVMITPEYVKTLAALIDHPYQDQRACWRPEQSK